MTVSPPAPLPLHYRSITFSCCHCELASCKLLVATSSSGQRTRSDGDAWWLMTGEDVGKAMFGLPVVGIPTRYLIGRCPSGRP